MSNRRKRLLEMFVFARFTRYDPSMVYRLLYVLCTAVRGRR